MRTISISLLAILASSACVYDNNCPDRQRGELGELDTGSEDRLDSPEYYLSPDTAQAGATVIVAMQSDQAVDFEAIQELSFLEDISICTSQARDDELLLTISVDQGVPPGAVDLIIEFEDGTHVFVEAGLTVLDPTADEVDTSDETDSDDSEDDGSGSDTPDEGEGGPETEGESQGGGCG